MLCNEALTVDTEAVGSAVKRAFWWPTATDVEQPALLAPTESHGAESPSVRLGKFLNSGGLWERSNTTAQLHGRDSLCSCLPTKSLAVSERQVDSHFIGNEAMYMYVQTMRELGHAVPPSPAVGPVVSAPTAPSAKYFATTFLRISALERRRFCVTFDTDVHSSPCTGSAATHLMQKSNIRGRVPLWIKRKYGNIATCDRTFA